MTDSRRSIDTETYAPEAEVLAKLVEQQILTILPALPLVSKPNIWCVRSVGIRNRASWKSSLQNTACRPTKASH